MRVRNSKQIYALLFISALVFISILIHIPVSAKTIRMKYKNRVNNYNAVKNSATVKVGSNQLILPAKGRGYVKFVPPSTNDYAFTVSNVKPINKSEKALGSFEFHVRLGSGSALGMPIYLNPVCADTKGGVVYSINFANKKTKYSANNKKLNYMYLTKRTGIRGTNKGDPILLFFDTKNVKSIKLTIK